jgi:uncharacterized protein DUF3738
MRKIVFLIIGAVCFVSAFCIGLAVAASPQAATTFEVASVKPSGPRARARRSTASGSDVDGAMALLQGTSISMQILTQQFQSQVDRPVIDKTGLKGSLNP